MKKKKWIDALVMITLLLIGGAIRVIYAKYYMTAISISDDILNMIKQNTGNPFACLSLSFDGIYAFIISFAIQYFGTKAIVGVGINILLQLISIFLIYYSIRIVSDTVIAAIPTLIIAILPVYIAMIGNLTSFTLIYVTVAAGVFIVLVLCKLISLLFTKDLDEEAYEEEEAEEENIGDVFQTEKEKDDLSEDALDVLTGEKYDFMHYDIEDMTDMDFFDLDS